MITILGHLQKIFEPFDELEVHISDRNIRTSIFTFDIFLNMFLSGILTFPSAQSKILSDQVFHFSIVFFKKN